MCSMQLVENFFRPCYVGHCHYGMVHASVLVAETASDMEDSCEYIEEAVADSRKTVVLQHGSWVRG